MHYCITFIVAGGGIEILGPEGAVVIESDDEQQDDDDQDRIIENQDNTYEQSPAITQQNEMAGQEITNENAFPQLTTIYQNDDEPNDRLMSEEQRFHSRTGHY